MFLCVLQGIEKKLVTFKQRCTFLLLGIYIEDPLFFLY